MAGSAARVAVERGGRQPRYNPGAGFFARGSEDGLCHAPHSLTCAVDDPR